MGRRAKYLTVAQRQAAQHVNASAYSATQRGKELRKDYNAHQFKRKHGRRHQKGAIPANTLSPVILSLATRPLPLSSKLFKDALKGPDYIDESGLSIWDTLPPYSTDSSDSLSGQQYTENLVQVMHGRRLRELEQEGESWYRQTGGTDGEGEVITAKIRSSVQRLKDEFNGMIRSLDSSDRVKREVRMAEHMLEWHAKRIYCWSNELEVREQGLSLYTQTYAEGSFRWQMMRHGV